MRRRFRRPKKVKPVEPRYRVNEKITAPQVMVIDEKGENLGVMETPQALQLAQEKELDLVEVFPKAEPPVCRILDYGKFQYKQDKQRHQAKLKQKKTGTKGVRLGLRTDVHDLDFKRRQAEKFLLKGNKVKIEMILRGREKAHKDLAKENLTRFLESINVPYTREEDIKSAPRGFVVLIAPE